MIFISNKFLDLLGKFTEYTWPVIVWASLFEFCSLYSELLFAIEVNKFAAQFFTI